VRIFSIAPTGVVSVLFAGRTARDDGEHEREEHGDDAEPPTDVERERPDDDEAERGEDDPADEPRARYFDRVHLRARFGEIVRVGALSIRAFGRLVLRERFSESGERAKDRAPLQAEGEKSRGDHHGGARPQAEADDAAVAEIFEMTWWSYAIERPRRS
jgi:hypothetical protein